MKRRIIKFKKLHLLIVGMFVFTSLLGISYACWTEGINITGFFQTTEILASCGISQNYQFCAYVHNGGECKNINPVIKINNDGKLRITIDSVEIVALQYQAARYEAVYRGRGSKKKFDHWEKSDTKKMQEDINYTIRNINTEVEVGDLQDIPLNINNDTKSPEYDPSSGISYNSLCKSIGKDLKLAGYNEYAESGWWIFKDIDYRRNINHIDVDEESILLVKINYKQWNTDYGWKKSIVKEIPVQWVRDDKIYTNENGEKYAH